MNRDAGPVLTPIEALREASLMLKRWDDSNTADNCYSDKFVWQAWDLIRASLREHDKK